LLLSVTNAVVFVMPFPFGIP